MSVRVDLRDLTWTPSGRRRPVLDGVDLSIGAGERVLLVGPSGAGKSTVLRAMAGLLEATDIGVLGGQALLDGAAADAESGLAGLLVQNPRDARVAEHVGRDVAFGCENAGMPRAEIAARVRWALDAVGFPYGPEHPVSSLSGGEAQRLALAGVVASQPGLLLLDEPTSMLDDASAAVVRDAVSRVQAATGATLVVVEHRLGPWADLLDRLVVLDAGGVVVADGPIGRVLAEESDRLLAAGVWVPGAPDPEPLAVDPALLSPCRADLAVGSPLVVADQVGLVRTPARSLTNSWRRREQVVALHGVDARVAAGRTLAVRGPSGAGKSSLVSLLTGLAAPTSGTVRADALAGRLDRSPHQWSSRELAARMGWVPQEAAATVVGRTVRESLTATADALGLDGADRAESLAEILGLSALLKRHPYRLSGGEVRRLAVASSLVHGPSVLALDEPTVGQDRHTWAAVTGLVAAARASGVGVVLSTHDPLAAALADSTAHLRRGVSGISEEGAA